jgi:hypothetical protein
LLQSLLTNELGGWTIFVSIEPTSVASELVSICEATLAGHSFEIAINDKVLGIRDNPHNALSRVFAAGSALNLHLEEDLLVSRDVTALSAWYVGHHEPTWLCLNLLAGPCGSGALLSDSRFPDELFLARTFNSLGFAVRREEWQSLMAPNWFGAGLPELAGGGAANWRTSASGWDWALYGLLASRTDLFSVQPVFARATHTGATGTHVTPEFQNKAFGDLQINTQLHEAFALVDIGELHRDVRSLVYAHEEMTELRLQLEKRARVAGGALARLADENRKRDNTLGASVRRVMSKLRRIVDRDHTGP